MSVPMRATVATAQATTPSCLTEAYREYAQRVARWAHNLGGAALDVDDVVQEVFLVVSRKLASYRPNGSFTSWLFEITRKVVANHRRRQGRQLLRTEGEERLESLPSQALDPAAELERRVLVELCYRALDELPEKYRTVFVLFELEDMSTQAIAELCRLKLPTVRVQLSRARNRFLRAYQKLVCEEAGGADDRLRDLAERTVGTVSRELVRLGKGIA
jgi:RNA polymerase sigma factor (sigma-70 family)